ncbi:phosphate ABC transporter substrate-binding protein PstS [Gryllotalpicola sp.]|uniref:phosphate ABC transporter substrate-binding protein PstS n=1 Tax=Gryllotalpicola sp. TaxID=1932787 RepID=UPI0026324973|nr:phosphate ABC transporter substrate-binding protein PstS [Gryllotalpicola sp.]
MKTTRIAATAALIAAAAIGLSACASSGASSSPSGSGTSTSGSGAALSGTITAGGSSAQANVQTAWTTGFTAANAGVKVNYDKSQGSGGGVTNFLAGSYDFAGTDASLKPDQFTKAKTTCGADGALDIPVYLSGVAIIYNLPGVTGLKLDATTIAKIFAGKITTWNDPAIAALNSGATLPGTAITVVRRSDGSGTTANFTTYLHQQDPTDWSWAAGTAWPTIPGDKSSGQQGGSGVVGAVTAGSGTIGYADQSAIGTATAAQIEVGTSGTFVDYSASGATAAFDAAAQDASQGAGDLTVSLDYTKIMATSAYPIPLLSYDVVCKTFKNAAQGALTKAYLTYVTSSAGQQLAAANAGAAPLPDSTLTKIAASLAEVK